MAKPDCLPGWDVSLLIIRAADTMEKILWINGFYAQ